mmetsp:Transcript_12485/g.17968  ORF Transcript_12485/g.17968 Transcript_12485/m.17968 type:complete len:392 (-) Transcript_12485:8-1183(-)
MIATAAQGKFFFGKHFVRIQSSSRTLATPRRFFFAAPKQQHTNRTFSGATASVLAAISAFGAGLLYSNFSSKGSSAEATRDIIRLHGADWETFHLQSLNYSEDDDEGDDLDEQDRDDDDQQQEQLDTQSAIGEEVDGAQSDELPDEDEPTTCSICLINRQGPCRDPWRRFERCIKRNSHHKSDEQASSSAEESNPSHQALACDELFRPWLDCFSRHRLTYTILTNKSLQPEMDFLEETYQTQEPFPEHIMPTLVLEQQEEEKQEEDGQESNGLQKKSIMFDLTNEETGNDIYVAYVRDEVKGNILGFDYFKSELEQKQKHQLGEAEEENETEVKKRGELIFHAPEGTTSVVAHALYKNSMTDEENEECDNKEKEDTEEKSLRTYIVIIKIK